MDNLPGYVSIVILPVPQVATLRLLAAQYSANAYPFSLRYQNCTQWVMELLASAWGDLAGGDHLRARAQAWPGLPAD